MIDKHKMLVPLWTCMCAWLASEAGQIWRWCGKPERHSAAEVWVQPTSATGGCALALDHLQPQVSTHVGQGSLVLQIPPPAVWNRTGCLHLAQLRPGMPVVPMQVKPRRMQSAKG